MPDKDAMRKELFKTVDQYVRDVLPEEGRGKARKILRAIKEGKAVPEEQKEE